MIWVETNFEVPWDLQSISMFHKAQNAAQSGKVFVKFMSETFIYSSYSSYCLVPTTNKLSSSQILLLTVPWFLPLLNHFQGLA